MSHLPCTSAPGLSQEWGVSTPAQYGILQEIVKGQGCSEEEGVLCQVLEAGIAERRVMPVSSPAPLNSRASCLALDHDKIFWLSESQILRLWGGETREWGAAASGDEAWL